MDSSSSESDAEDELYAHLKKIDNLYQSAIMILDQD